MPDKPNPVFTPEQMRGLERIKERGRYGYGYSLCDDQGCDKCVYAKTDGECSLRFKGLWYGEQRLSRYRALNNFKDAEKYLKQSKLKQLGLLPEGSL